MEPGKNGAAGNTETETWKDKGLAFVRTPAGMLKLLQAVLSLMTFILSVSKSQEDGYHGGGWVHFSAINGLIVACVYGTLHLFDVIPQIIANYFVEFIMYLFMSAFFFIAFIIAASAGAVDPVIGATAFFAFVCTGLFGADAVLQGLDIRRRRAESSDGSATTGGGTELPNTAASVEYSKEHTSKPVNVLY